MTQHDIETITEMIDALHNHQEIDELKFLMLIDPIINTCLTRKHYRYRINIQDDLYQEVHLWLLRMIHGEIKLPSHSYLSWLYFCIDKLISKWCKKNLSEIPIGNLIVDDFFPEYRGEDDD